MKSLERRIETSGYGGRPNKLTGVDLQPVKYGNYCDVKMFANFARGPESSNIELRKLAPCKVQCKD